MKKWLISIATVVTGALLVFFGRGERAEQGGPDYEYKCVEVYNHDFEYDRAHLRTAVDTAYERFGFKCAKLKLHYTTPWFEHYDSKAKGRLYKEDGKAYIGVQEEPDHTASLIVHEMGHWYLYKWEEVEDADPRHSRTEFWKLADKPVGL